jgi:hypothetical protein
MPKRTTAKTSFSSAVFQPEILPVVKETVEVSVPEVVPVVEASVPEVVPVVEETVPEVVPVVEETVEVSVPEVVPVVEASVPEVVPVVEETVVPVVEASVPEVVPVVEESVFAIPEVVPVEEEGVAVAPTMVHELSFASLLPVSSETKSFQDILDEKASLMEQLKNMSTSDVDITTYQPLKKEEEQSVSTQQHQHYNTAAFWNKFIPRRA